VTAATEIWSYRNLIYNLAQRELRSRYKKSLLGWLWSLINPAAMLLIYSLVFGIILEVPPPVAGNGELESYGLYLFAGLFVWNFFSGTVNGAIAALQGAGGLLNKVYFPPSAPAIANTMTVLLQALIEGGILAVVMIALGNAGITFLMFPVILIFVGLFALGLGLFLSVFNVFYRDVGYLVGIGMQVLFYATPIIYPLTLVEANAPGALTAVVKLNPLTRMVYWSKDAFYSLQWPSLASFAGAAGAALVTFAVGWMVFSVKARNIAEEL
jgi:ABC-type polysaccharide/polyol phosphate export permease